MEFGFSYSCRKPLCQISLHQVLDPASAQSWVQKYVRFFKNTEVGDTSPWVPWVDGRVRSAGNAPILEPFQIITQPGMFTYWGTMLLVPWLMLDPDLPALKKSFAVFFIVFSLLYLIVALAFPGPTHGIDPAALGSAVFSLLDAEPLSSAGRDALWESERVYGAPIDGLRGLSRNGGRDHPPGIL
jgi:hypothetical protein